MDKHSNYLQMIGTMTEIEIILKEINGTRLEPRVYSEKLKRLNELTVMYDRYEKEWRNESMRELMEEKAKFLAHIGDMTAQSMLKQMVK